MNQSDFQKTLETLRDELHRADSVDDETRQLLTDLAVDIQRLAEKSTNQSSEEVEPISERVQDMLLKFESDHPQLTAILNQISAGLANLGI